MKKNWFLPVSSVFFFLLYGRSWLSYYIGIPLAVLLVTFLSAITPPLTEKMKKMHFLLRCYSLINSFGICWGSLYVYRSFVFRWGGSGELLRTAFALLGLPAVYVANILFCEKITGILKDILSPAKIKRTEVLLYALVLLVLSGFVGFFFLKSPAFYATSNPFDVIYTTDTPSMVRLNAYVVLNFRENDIRQPLFSVFAAPFSGVPSLLGCFTPDVFRAWLLDIFQIAILMLTNVMLAIRLELSKIQRICFVLFFSFTHTCLLFSLLMEQYIIAYFFLILAIILLCEQRKEARLATCAAGGTLLTSLALTPLLFPMLKRRDFRKEKGKYITGWIADMFRTGVDFLLLVFLFSRLDVLLDSVDNMMVLSKFSGESVGFINRFQQYTHFVRNLFIAPNAGPVKGEWDSWQLDPISSISILGVIVLIITAVCFLVTWKNKMSRIAGGWILFSFVILIIIGWGTSENGLVLYSLYFGWAYFVLIFQALKALEEKLKCRFIIPVFTAAAVIAMLVATIPGFMDMMDFAVGAYPG
ncbi:MAG: hypothetical protein J6Y58_02475 [Clostridiales bacterium]|nr:hypothetical protein [Clostridiales bacterium]